MSDVIHLTTGAFQKVMAQGSLILIDFWAPSTGREPRRALAPTRPQRGLAAAEPRCGPCRLQGPILDEVAKAASDGVIVAKVNVDEEPRLASQYGVSSIPTLLIIKEGQILNRMVGVQTAQILTSALQKADA